MNACGGAHFTWNHTESHMEQEPPLLREVAWVGESIFGV